MIIINKEGYHYFPCDVVSTKDWELTMKSDTTKYVHTIFGDNNIIGDYYKIWFNWDDLELMGNGEFNYDLKDTDGISLSKGVLRIDFPEDSEFKPERSGDYVIYETNMDGYLTTQEGDCTTCYNMGYMEGIGKADYMYFKALTNGAVALINYNGNQPVNLRYSFDKRMWTPWYGEEIVLRKGSNIYVYADTIGKNFNEYSSFVVNGDIECHGSIMSLNGFNQKLKDYYTFYRLFKDCDILTAPTLDYMYVGFYDYYEMFSGCKRLTVAPDLPATSIGSGAYREMFDGCSNLTTAPFSIPVRTVSHQGCLAMFRNCVNLEEPPILSAELVKGDGYHRMFVNCRKINYCEIDAWYIEGDPFYQMFLGCLNLNNIAMQVYDFGDTKMDNWLHGAAPEGDLFIGTFATLPEGALPDGWMTFRYYATNY